MDRKSSLARSPRVVLIIVNVGPNRTAFRNSRGAARPQVLLAGAMPPDPAARPSPIADSVMKRLRNQHSELLFWRLKWGNPIHILRARRSRTLGRIDVHVVAARLSSFRRRRFHEPVAGRVLPAKAVALARGTGRRLLGHLAAPQGRKPVEARSDRPRLARDRTRDRAAHPRSRAQADLEDQCRAKPH